MILNLIIMDQKYTGRTKYFHLVTVSVKKFNVMASKHSTEKLPARPSSASLNVGRASAAVFFFIFFVKIKKSDVLIIVLRAGRALMGCRPPDCLPTQEEDEEGECKRGRRLSVTTRSSP